MKERHAGWDAGERAAESIAVEPKAAESTTEPAATADAAEPNGGGGIAARENRVLAKWRPVDNGGLNPGMTPPRGSRWQRDMWFWIGREANQSTYSATAAWVCEMETEWAASGKIEILERYRRGFPVTTPAA